MKGLRTWRVKPVIQSNIQTQEVEDTGFDWFGVNNTILNTVKTVVKEVKCSTNENIVAETIELTLPLEDSELDSIKKWSFGPFVPFYSLIHHLWDFVLARIAVGSIYLFFLWAITIKQGVRLDSSAMFNQGAWWTFFYSLAMLFLLLWECKIAKRLSWNRLRWIDYKHHFEHENVWNIFGCICLGISVIWFFWDIYMFMP